ncbi:sulfotransferase [Patescibacteria group bacterium]|nr:sulfotransferase [Patescibacteria group bacterium]
MHVSTHPYTRFVIIGSHRSGSNYLSSLLSSHPNIMSIGELYNPSVLFADPGKPNLHGNKLAQMIRNITPIWFLRRFIFHAYPPHVHAVGFRYFYLHAQGRFRSVLDYIIKDRTIRIIHLKRRNLLRSYWSLRAAQETGIWTVPSSSPLVQPPVRLTLTPEECIAYFTRMEAFEKTFNTYFSHHALMKIEYEQLCKHLASEQKRLAAFLGVPSHPLSASTKKLNNVPLHSIITNYAALHHHFRNTQWRHFFEE